jgi:hypothetical protein
MQPNYERGGRVQQQLLPTTILRITLRETTYWALVTLLLLHNGEQHQHTDITFTNISSALRHVSPVT